MLVERRISTKINYDVLRDIEIDSTAGGPAEEGEGGGRLSIGKSNHVTDSSPTGGKLDC